jgi:hypothetical protein
MQYGIKISNGYGILSRWKMEKTARMKEKLLTIMLVTLALLIALVSNKIIAQEKLINNFSICPLCGK